MKRVLALFVFALGSGFGFTQFDTSSMFLMQASVASAMNRGDIRKELKLSRDQAQAIDKIEKSIGAPAKSHRGSDSGLAEAMTEMGNFDEANKQIEAVLDDGQRKRLTEIRIQMMGPPGFQSPMVADMLGLSDDQKAQVKTIQSDYTNEMTNTARSNRGAGLYKALAKKRAEADAKLIAVLTDDQKARYKEIQGKPFKDARQKDPIF